MWDCKLWSLTTLQMSGLQYCSMCAALHCSTCRIKICNSALGLLQAVELWMTTQHIKYFFTLKIFPFQIFFIYQMCENIFIPTCPSLNPWCGGGVCPSCRSWSRGRAASSASPAACPASADSLSGLKNIYQQSSERKLFETFPVDYYFLFRGNAPIPATATVS